MQKELETVRAVAKYDFLGRNNDELPFVKNDVIAIIQMLDGGWWEGSLNGKIGWFPSNFVNVIDKESNGGLYDAETRDLSSKQTEFRNEIISTFLEAEREHVASIDRIRSVYLSLIENSNVLSKDEFMVLSSNIDVVYQQKKLLLKRCEEEFKLPLAQQKFGQLFLDFASEFYSVMEIYCENHCIAVELINIKRNALSSLFSSNKLDLKDMITGLSTIFRHFDKYKITLQEIERNTSEVHPDRGNLKRASSVYSNLYNFCDYTRKQKDAQMEFLASGTLVKTFSKDWQNVLGNFLYIGKVTVVFLSSDSVVRCIAVFTKSILFFDSLISKNSYDLKNRISCSELVVAKDNFKLTINFRKNSANIQSIKAFVNDDFQRLVKALKSCSGVHFDADIVSASEGISAEGHRVGEDSADCATATSNTAFGGVEAEEECGDPIFGGGQLLGQRRTSMRSKKLTLISQEKSTAVPLFNVFALNHELEMIMPEGVTPPAVTHQRKSDMSAHELSTRSATRQGKPYSGWCLRPLPPPRADHFHCGSGSAATIKMRKGLSMEEQEDALMLKIVEGYCCTGSGSNGVVQHRHHYHPQQHYLFNGGGSSHRSPSSARICSDGSMGSGGGLIGGITGPAVRRAASYPDEATVGVRPQLIVAETEKLFVEEMDGDEVVVRERSLVDTVYALKDQLAEIQKEIGVLTKNLDKEQKARRRFEESMRRGSPQLLSAHGGGPATVASEG